MLSVLHKDGYRIHRERKLQDIGRYDHRFRMLLIATASVLEFLLHCTYPCSLSLHVMSLVCCCLKNDLECFAVYIHHILGFVYDAPDVRSHWIVVT